MALSRKVLLHPAFLAGLVLRLVLVACVTPNTQAQWFTPFFERFLAAPSFDPWSSFLAQGGTILAFPYGSVMFLLLLPFAALGEILGHLVGAAGVGLGLRFGLLFADFVLFALLARLFPQAGTRLIWFYWWSPIVILVNYWVGQLDIVPVSLLVLSLVMIKELRPGRAGLALALSLSAKISMAAALPFYPIYFWRNERIRAHWRALLLRALPVLALGLGPPLLSWGYRAMVLGTRETERLFELSFAFGDARIYLTPALYLASLYAAWRLSRMSFELFYAVIGLSLFLLVLSTPAPPGWYFWLVPFLTAQLIHGERLHQALIYGFSALIVGLHLAYSPGPSIEILHADFPDGVAAALAWSFPPLLRSEILTLEVATGAIIILQMIRDRIRRNDVFRLGQKPITIAIAGDSSAGKDTLAENLAGLFGQDTIVHISGDDYHVWDRYAPMWKALTHLNPRGNDLLKFATDVRDIIERKSIVCRRYDHTTGRFSQPVLVRSKELVIVSGLHALYFEDLVALFNIRIFLEVNEPLRLYWKARRDLTVRGHSSRDLADMLERRRPDSCQFISPQQKNAQIVFSLNPANQEQPLDVENDPSNVRLELTVLLRQSLYYERLSRELIGLCGLRVESEFSDKPGEVRLIIEGDVEAEDVALAARALAPGTLDLLAIEPHWQGDVSGLMQLIVLAQLDQNIRSR